MANSAGEGAAGECIDDVEGTEIDEDGEKIVKTPTIAVARKTLNARTEVNSLTNRNGIQRYLEQRRSTLGEKKGKGVDGYV